jgi:hypothetical protein
VIVAERLEKLTWVSNFRFFMDPPANFAPRPFHQPHNSPKKKKPASDRPSSSIIMVAFSKIIDLTKDDEEEHNPRKRLRTLLKGHAFCLGARSLIRSKKTENLL